MDDEPWYRESTARAPATWADGDVLPPHASACLGCGPDNPHGLHLETRRDGDGVRARLVVDERHQGAPGISHGGAVAVAFDELLGSVLFLVGEPTVTRELTVEYLRPVLLGRAYDLTGRVTRRDGRKIWTEGEATDADDGGVVARSRAFFLVVPVEHFDVGGAAGATAGLPFAP